MTNTIVIKYVLAVLSLFPRVASDNVLSLSNRLYSMASARSEETGIHAQPKNRFVVRLLPEFTIGQSIEGEGSYLSSLSFINVDEDENIYAIDSKESLIKVFDNNGKYLRSFGKKGVGPGEYRGLSSISFSSDKNLVLFDSGNRRIIFCSKEGKHIKDISTAKWNFLRVIPDKDKNIYADNLIFSDKGVTQILSKYSPELEELLVASSNSSNIVLPKINIMTDRFVFDILSNNKLVWAFTDDYKVMTLNKDGTSAQLIKGFYKKRNILESDKKAILLKRYGEAGPPKVIEIVFPITYSPIRSLTVDDKDRIYISTTKEDGQEKYLVDVYQKDGEYIGYFSLDTDESLRIVKTDMAYCIIPEDANGLPVIKKYKIEIRPRRS